jgi:hypothetical protein
MLGMTRIQHSTNPQAIQMCKVYSNCVTVPITSGVTWTSTDTSIANIDSNGNLTFTGANGITTITGTYNGQTISQRVITNTVSNTSPRKWLRLRCLKH